MAVIGGFSMQLVDIGRSSRGVIGMALVEKLEANEVATEEFDVIEDWAAIECVSGLATCNAWTTCVKAQAC